jgi:hypothetical protein
MREKSEEASREGLRIFAHRFMNRWAVYDDLLPGRMGFPLSTITTECFFTNPTISRMLVLDANFHGLIEDSEDGSWRGHFPHAEEVIAAGEAQAGQFRICRAN